MIGPGMKTMHGFPTAPDDQVTLANWRSARSSQWAFHHVREILPTAAIARGERRWELPRAPRRLDSVTFDDREGRSHTLEHTLRDTNTDAFIVLKNGRIVEERYDGGMGPGDPHISMSVSKSLTALLAGSLIDQGALDPSALVVDYLPEIVQGPYATATLQQLLDMQVGVAFDEDYTATDGIMLEYRRATGWNPGGERDDLRSFITRLEMRGRHGGPFTYISPNVDLLGWIIERRTGVRFADLFSRALWQPLGAEFDAYVTVDRLGAPRVAGGICMTLRDLARVGQMMLERGLANGHAVLSSDWIADTVNGGDHEAWRRGDFVFLMPNGRYRNLWYQTGDDLGAFLALGIHGQFLYVAPAADVVIARFASYPDALDPLTESLLIDAFGGIARAIA